MSETLNQAAYASASYDAPEGLLETNQYSAGFGLPLLYLRSAALRTAENIHIADASITLVLSGSGKRWLTLGHSQYEFDTTPGMIGMCGGGQELTRGIYKGTPGELITLSFPEHIVQSIVREGGNRLCLRTEFAASDMRVAWLMRALWEASCSGQDDGLYSQGLTLALLGVLGQVFSQKEMPAELTANQFSRGKRRILMELIEQHLSERLSVTRLANEVDMSPQHFTRVFGRTFGKSPYAYVLSMRIKAAAQVLSRDLDRSIADIAATYGFASQAHFTKCFRDHMGETPAKWRRR